MLFGYGIKHLDSVCIQPLAEWMVVMGVVSWIAPLMGWGNRVWRVTKGLYPKPGVTALIVLLWFIIAWIIVGSLWVWGAHGISEDRVCDHELSSIVSGVLIAFWCAVATTGCGCCLFVVYLCLSGLGLSSLR